MQEEKIIQINADAFDSDSPRDASTSAPVRFRRGDTITVDVLLSMRGVPISADGFRNATMEILDVGSVNSPSPRPLNLLMWRRLEEIETPEASADGLPLPGARHLRFTFTKEESAVERGEKWLRLYADFEGGKRVTFASGWIYVDDNFSADASALPLESPEFIGRSELEETYYSRAEMDELRGRLDSQFAGLSALASEASAHAAEAREFAAEAGTSGKSAGESAASAQSDAARAAEALSGAEGLKTAAAASAGSASESAALAGAYASELRGVSESVWSFGRLKAPREGMRLDGGVIKVPGSASKLLLSAPFSVGIIMDISDAGTPVNINWLIAGTNTPPGRGVDLHYIPSSGRYQFSYRTDMGYCTMIFPGQPAPSGLVGLVLTVSNEWMSYNENTGKGCLDVRLYINNVEAQRQVYAGELSGKTIPTQADWHIGGSASNVYVSSTEAAGSYGLYGDFHNAVIYDRVLSASEISAYHAGKVPVNPRMWLNRGAGLQWRDDSGGGLHGFAIRDGEECIRHDAYVMDDEMTWTSSGTKYVLSSTDKVLPDNCRFNAVLMSDTACSVSLKNGAGAEYANVTLAAGAPFDAGTFINTTDGKLSLTPSVPTATIKANLEIRRL